MPEIYRLRFSLGFVIFSLICVQAMGQTKKRTVHRQKLDTTTNDLTSKISDSILREAEVRDTTVPYMVNKIESYTFSLNRAENFFDRKLVATPKP